MSSPALPALLALLASTVATAATTGLIQLIDPLDEPEFYCIDVPGFRNNVQLDAPLMAHTCKPGAADELFTIEDGRFRMEAYDRCMQAGALEAGGELLLKTCSDSPQQRFTFSDDGKLHPEGRSDLCVAVAAGEGTPTGGPSHLRRDLSLDTCEGVDSRLILWKAP